MKNEERRMKNLLLSLSCWAKRNICKPPPVFGCAIGQILRFAQDDKHGRFFILHFLGWQGGTLGVGWWDNCPSVRLSGLSGAYGGCLSVRLSGLSSFASLRGTMTGKRKLMPFLRMRQEEGWRGGFGKRCNDGCGKWSSIILCHSDVTCDTKEDAE